MGDTKTKMRVPVWMALAVCAMAVVFSLFTLTAAPAHAAEADVAAPDATQTLTVQATKTVKEKETWIWAGTRVLKWFETNNYSSWLQIGTEKSTPLSMYGDNVKISNKKVIGKIKNLAGRTSYAVKKPGKTTVSYMTRTGSSGDQSSVKHVDTITVIKYASPIASLKIGKTDYAKKLKTEPLCVATKALKGKVSIKPAKGWKVEEIRVRSANDPANYKTVKQGAKVNLKKDIGYLEAVCYNKAKKQRFSVFVSANYYRVINYLTW